MDVIKSRLTRATRASDIALLQIVFMNSIMNGIIYDWETVLADQMEEFMTLQHYTSVDQAKFRRDITLLFTSEGFTDEVADSAIALILETLHLISVVDGYAQGRLQVNERNNAAQSSNTHIEFKPSHVHNLLASR